MSECKKWWGRANRGGYAGKAPEAPQPRQKLLERGSQISSLPSLGTFWAACDDIGSSSLAFHLTAKSTPAVNMATHQSLAQDLFEDMGRKVAEASAQDDSEDGTKVVDEIESLCMNCHENVFRPRQECWVHG